MLPLDCRPCQGVARMHHGLRPPAVSPPPLWSPKSNHHGICWRNAASVETFHKRVDAFPQKWRPFHKWHAAGVETVSQMANTLSCVLPRERMQVGLSTTVERAHRPHPSVSLSDTMPGALHATKWRAALFLSCQLANVSPHLPGCSLLTGSTTTEAMLAPMRTMGRAAATARIQRTLLTARLQRQQIRPPRPRQPRRR